MARERQRSDTNQCEHPNHRHQQQQQPPRPPSPLCLSLGETERDRVTGKDSSATQHPVSRNRDRKTSHHTQVVEAMATRVRWQCDSALQGAERTEQGRQSWLSAFFCFSCAPAPLRCLCHHCRCCRREKITLRTGQRDSCCRRRSSSIHMF